MLDAAFRTWSDSREGGALAARGRGGRFLSREQ